MLPTNEIIQQQNSNFIYFTMIMKQVYTTICIPVVFVWEETGVSGGTHLSHLVAT